MGDGTTKLVLGQSYNPAGGWGLRRADAQIVGPHRYMLTREWCGPGFVANGPLHRVCWIMLNPSTADGDTDDPTVRKCVGFTHRWGYCGMVIVNLFAIRGSKPSVIHAPDALGPGNDETILATAGLAKLVVVAWGMHAPSSRGNEVLSMLARRGIEPVALGVTLAGMPFHPSRAPYSLRPKPYRELLLESLGARSTEVAR